MYSWIQKLPELSYVNDNSQRVKPFEAAASACIFKALLSNLKT